uniref:hypothetical protein n=1 Tax=Desulfurobacterium sp. TaxID=2004706 RepID=UPI002617C987
IIETLITIFVMLLVFINILINPPIGKTGKLSAKTQAVIMRLIALLMLLAVIYGYYPFFTDCVFYLKTGNSYLKKQVCVVEKTVQFPILFFIKKTVICKNGESFEMNLTFKNFFPGEKVVVCFLPKSRIIVKEEILSSPYEKRNH